MSRYCTNCGTQLHDGFSFCTHCGVPVPAPQNAEQQETPSPTEQPTNQPLVCKHPSVETSTVTNQQNSVISTGEFFGLLLLFLLPFVGWIICLVFAFAPKNENRKHFARAVILWMLLTTILCIILCFVAVEFFHFIVDASPDVRFYSSPELFEHFFELEGGRVHSFPMS